MISCSGVGWKVLIVVTVINGKGCYYLTGLLREAVLVFLRRLHNLGNKSFICFLPKVILSTNCRF